MDTLEDPSDLTIDTYRKNFGKYVQRTPEATLGEFRAWLDAFASHIPDQGTILEIGSAAGRDARYFASKGFRVLCTDVIPEALLRLSIEGFETSEFDFRSRPRPEWANSFDGFFANAVLLHAPQEIFENALKNMALVLKRGGVAAFSLKAGEGEEISLEKLEAPRYFRYHSEPEIREVISRLPFEILSITHAEQGKWLHVIMKHQAV
ncbi:methyltransferase domain protein [mine drainage metagenome]|uniref:Methyltransferase domain protein n=1 Tax=mine drainage metagenome TaxID=410659 RepID=A0A1J5QP87_9ZZZZ